MSSTVGHYGNFLSILNQSFSGFIIVRKSLPKFLSLFFGVLEEDKYRPVSILFVSIHQK